MVRKVDAVVDIKKRYQVNNWSGDPCAPKNFTWDGLNCSFNSFEPPRIISLNLSSKGLTGEIDAAFSKLKALQYLDLSSNSLNGTIPDSLAELSSLQFLNLTGNHLTGPVPPVLLQRNASGSLLLSIGDNPDLCYESDSCKKRKTSAVVIIVISTILAALVILVAVFVWRTKNRRQLGSIVQLQKASYSREDVKHKDMQLRWENQQFTYQELVSITKNFERLLGRGGFGSVYHGILEDGTEVAVKMRSQSSSQGTKEFQTEAQLLTRVHHRNLVSLVGYCKDENHMALIYEYMSEGSLQEHLTGNSGSNGALGWNERLRIALEAAIGLEYLHKGCRPPIIHRDVKTSNILLSQKREAKIADFGLSKAFPNDAATHVSTDVVGTFGYLDPEYYYTYQLNEKSDVYSFGIVILELITGLPAIHNDRNMGHIVQWVRPMLASGDIDKMVDGRMQGDYDINSIWKAAEIALRCTLPTSVQRPTMSDVVMQLKECLALEISYEQTHKSEMESPDSGYGSLIDVAPLQMNSIGPSAR